MNNLPRLYGRATRGKALSALAPCGPEAGGTGRKKVRVSGHLEKNVFLCILMIYE